MVTISKNQLSNEKVPESASIIRLDSGSAKAGYQLCHPHSYSRDLLLLSQPTALGKFGKGSAVKI